VVTFDARDPGTGNEAWIADPRLAALPALDLARFASVWVLAAHPDDETLGAGGLIASAAVRGLSLTVVVATDGRDSSAGVSGVAPTRPGPLVATRAREVAEAVEILAPGSDPVLLDYPDGTVREEREAITQDLRGLLASRRKQGAVLLVAPWRGDGHRDHRVLGEIAAEIAGVVGWAPEGSELWEYPIWLWHWGTPDAAVVPWSELASLALDADSRRAKRRALGRFVSQRTPRGDQPAMLHERFLENFQRDVETFVVTR
jgi:LmbE family N-acetylglucosaminyl deacetylase